MIRKTALVIGIPSVLVIIGGVTLCLLMHFTTEVVIEGLQIDEKEAKAFDSFISTFNFSSRPHRDVDDPYFMSDADKVHIQPKPAESRDRETNLVVENASTMPLWTVGILYIIPGVLGLLSACFQNRCLYITSIIFSVIFLLIMAIVAVASFFFLVMFALSFSIVNDQCKDENNSCKCGTDLELTFFKKCSYFKSFFTLIMAMEFTTIITWVFFLVLFIILCYYTCCAKSEGSHGVVLSSAQQPMLNQSETGTYTQQTYQYPPPQQYLDQNAPSKV